MNTDSRYLAIANDKWCHCFQPAKKQEWDALRQQGCNDTFQADAIQNFFPRTCCSKHKKCYKREPTRFQCTENVRK